MWDKCRNLAERAQVSSDPGYVLALLLLILRSDKQGRISVSASAKYLRGFARDLLSYKNLLVAISGNILSRRYPDLVQNMPELFQINFDPDQLTAVEARLGTVAECLMTLPVDTQGRTKTDLAQNSINRLQAAIGRSQNQT